MTKKIFLLFIVFDLVIVGVILKVRESQRPNRGLAQTTDTGLTEGQTQKMHLIQNLIFQFTAQKIILQSDYLQPICESATLIALKFKAIDVAVSGQPPQIIHTHSCSEISALPTQNQLETDIGDFTSLHRQDGAAGMRAHALYRDEEFPQRWSLYEIQISGDLNFTINEAELTQFSSQNFSFGLNQNN